MMKKSNEKILVIPSWYPPRGGYFFREHAMALAAAGQEVDVLAGLHTGLRSLNLSNLKNIRKTTILRDGGITEYLKKYWIIPYSNRSNVHCWTSMMMRFYKKYHHQQGPPKLILAHSSLWAGLVAAFIREKYGIPYVITEHRSRFVYNTREAKRLFEPWYFPYLKTAFEGASRVVTVSDALQPFITQIAPATESKLQGIPNMVDCSFFSPGGYKKPSGPFCFFSLGNLIPLKGMAGLIEAFGMADQALPSTFELVIGGDGPERKKLEQLAAAKGLQEKISFAGRMDRQQVLAQMRDSHAFVLSSHFEAFGVVFIEAMATGLPVIAGRAGGPETFISKETGLLVEPGNPDRLAAAMLELHARYDGFNRQRIRELTVSRFGKPAVVAQYLELFEKILNNTIS